MKFTILGAAGYVGRHLLSRLAADGAEVEAPARDDMSIFERPLGNVLYCVGLTADFRSRPFDTVEAHVTLLARVLEQANLESLLYLSSTRFYGAASIAGTDEPIRVDPREADALYDLSKLLGEALCLRDHRAVRVVRLSNVYGGERPSPSFIEMIMNEARSGEIVLRSAENSAKDFVHVDDVVPILVKIATGGKRRLYNVASGKNATFGEIAGIIASAMSATIRVAPGAATVVAPCIDVAPIESEFGWAPRLLQSGLEEMLAVTQPPETESGR